ncbi:MAG TPA: tetratricopeptide repeat protein [Candidatus Omnitrophota bacterium]|mgnify:CR=1 FL=1|nr:tetratricopeptide repeat protein [Candidatus Omnitrophota bacterium]HPS37032.1 tetratricopeptide repeat protein [Candidatus Omnitrophota bacterium]
MTNTSKILICGSLACLILLPVVFAAEQSDRLDEARKLVEDKKYSDALNDYAAIAERLLVDPGLMIEWARVYTYADRHKEAIELFEKVRTNYPDREKQVLRELADQYKWDGQLEKAIATYRRGLELDPGNLQIELGLAQAFAWDHRHKEAIQMYDKALAKNPDDLTALLGKAEVLSWDDKLEKAKKIYEEVLRKDPGNLDAQNGIARICVWQGYHRRGIKRYKEILKDHPENADAMEGIAFAHRWNGDDPLALDDAEKLMTLHPDRHAGRELYNDIKNVKRPQVLQANRFSDDSNNLYIAAEKVHVGSYVGDLTKIGATYEWYLYRQHFQSPVNGNRGGVDISHRFNEYLEANSYMYLAKYNTSGFTPFTTNTWLTLKPCDMLRLDAAYDRETVEDIVSLQNKIFLDSGSISFDLKPNRYWFFSAKYKRSHYKDGNNQNTAFARAEYRVWQKPYLKLFYNYYYSDFADQMNHGYFNPVSIFSNTGGIYGSTNLGRRIFAETELSTGYEVQDPKSSRPTFHASANLNYMLTSTLSVFGRGEYFIANDTNPGKRYSKGSIWFGLTYSFGGAPVRAHEAQQPQRPLV